MKRKVISALAMGIYVASFIVGPSVVSTVHAEDTTYKPFKSAVMEEERAKE